MSGRHTRSRVRQQARVYAWEDAVVTIADRRIIPFVAAQGIVDAIWAELGLHYPPKVERLPRLARRLQADGSRLRLPEVIPPWLLLH